jgi:hypothetical protein
LLHIEPAARNRLTTIKWSHRGAHDRWRKQAMKKKETGLTKLAAKIGDVAGRTSSAIARASTALKETIMPPADEAKAKGKKKAAAERAKPTAVKRAAAKPMRRQPRAKKAAAKKR